MTPSEAPDPTSVPAQQGENSNPPEYRPNWKVIVPIVLISAVVLLVCLPVCALLIVNSTGCCLANGPEKMITFWASMIAGFLALFGMLVTGVFVITSLRVEATARAMAQLEAREEMWKYIKRYHAELIENLETLSREVTEGGEDAKSAIANATAEVKAEQDQASAAIIRVRNETTNAADEAQREIGGARAQTTAAANETQAAIRNAGQEVERQRDETNQAIDSARQEVETAARTARDRIDRAGEPPQGGDESR